MSAVPSSNGFEYIRPSIVTVTAFKQSWTLVDGTAYDWIGAASLDLDHLSGIFPGLITDADISVLWDHILAGGFDKRCELTARAALGRAAGKDWWWALNMIKKILSGWPIFNGVMIRQGVRIQDTGLADYLDAVYSLLWEHGKDEDRMKLDVELSALPKGVRVRQSPEARKAMLAKFAAD